MSYLSLKVKYFYDPFRELKLNKVMKYIFTFLIVCMFSFISNAQEIYSKVRIDLQEIGLEQIANLGIDLTEGTYSKGKFFESDLESRELVKLDAAGINYSIIYEDVSAFYADRAAADQPSAISRILTDEWTVPENWEYGSMGGFYTLDEVMAELDDMFAMFPELISESQPLSSSNLTHNGRMQYWVRISDNPTVNENEPEVLYTGLHHAREPMSVQQMIFYMWYVLENYDTDDEIKQLVDNTEMYFVPVVNPDGYEYNHLTNPNGGGNWRKNRRNNGGGSYGVDPNRNYGYMWGYDNQGSSPDPNDATYRGPSAFSEPEIQNIRDLCELNEFKIALNYHSYSNLLLYTWGWKEEPCEDDEILHDFAVIMTKENNYTYGPGSTAIYPTNGGSDDWMYGEQTTKDAIFSYTPEIGSSSDGFWPSTSRIIPLCQQQMWQNLSAARLVGRYASITDKSPTIIGDRDGFLPFEIKRLGLTDAELFTVTIQPLDDYMQYVGDPVSFENLDLMETAVDSIDYTLDENIEAGMPFSYLLIIDNGDYIVADTIEKIFGDLVTIFEDDCDDMENWSSDIWNNTTIDFHSSPASITDSPNSNYQDNEDNIILLDSIIDLSDVTIAVVQFWAKWDIESGYDYVQFMVKDDLLFGNWESLAGKYTKTGTSYQQEGEPVYDGRQDTWIMEEINLGKFVGKQISFRFVLVSDGAVTEDGYYFDDFEIKVVSETTDIPYEYMEKKELQLFNAFPNPTSNIVKIQYHLCHNQSQTLLEIIDILGNIVHSQTVYNSERLAIIDISDYSNGVYFYRLSAKSGISETKRFIKQ